MVDVGNLGMSRRFGFELKLYNEGLTYNLGLNFE